jgi:hypothetical protein
MSGFHPTARLPISTLDTVAQSSVFTHLPLRGQRRDHDLQQFEERIHRLPCFTLSTQATEHLKQAAKVRGLGVERQLKPGRRARISTGAQYSDANLVPHPQQRYQRATNPQHNNKGEPHARHDHQQSKAWYFPYAYRKLRNEAGHYHPGIAVLLKEAHG